MTPPDMIDLTRDVLLAFVCVGLGSAALLLPMATAILFKQMWTEFKK
jgi:hypothetical protein